MKNHRLRAKDQSFDREVRLSPLFENDVMTGSPGSVSLDFTSLEEIYCADRIAPERLATAILERAFSCADPAVWLCRFPVQAVETQVQQAFQRRSAGASLPLFGFSFAVKDNIDVAGFPTSAACPAFAYLAERTAPVVIRLQQAGAILVGKTNLDQFAAGLAGDRSPAGACRNVFAADYISGGSSSGSAVAVARGLVSFALGTDTAGSGRVPAGCNNIVGLKPTPGALDNDGIVPACRSLDCVSIMALTCEDARRVFAVAAGADEAEAPVSQGASFAFAVPRPQDLEFFGDEDQGRLFANAIDELAALGGRCVEIDYTPFRQTAALLYEGPWLAERYAGLQEFMAAHAEEMHPVTRTVIQGGARFTAVDVFKGLARLKELRPECARVFAAADVLVVPTMPCVPTLAEVQADSIGWSRRLGYYTNFVNLLGWAALAVPAGFTRRGLPGGITLIGPAESEARLCDLGTAWQRKLNLKLGGTEHLLPEPRRAESAVPAVARGCVRVAVAGAHLRGQPLHDQLLQTKARFVRACRTAPRYRFVALMDLDPPRPGLIREEGARGAVAVEIYDLPFAGFGKLVASVAPPLAIGTIELSDGERVKGFLCESWAAAGARDITGFGGWLSFRTAHS